PEEAAPPEEPEVAEETDLAPALVAVNVETVPAGAEAKIEGTDLACSPTPCELQTAPGQEITVSAVRGRAQGNTVVTPEGRTTVQILLTEPKRVRTVSAKTRKTSTTQGGRG